MSGHYDRREAKRKAKAAALEGLPKTADPEFARWLVNQGYSHNCIQSYCRTVTRWRRSRKDAAAWLAAVRAASVRAHGGLRLDNFKLVC